MAVSKRIVPFAILVALLVLAHPRMANAQDAPGTTIDTHHESTA